MIEISKCNQCKYWHDCYTNNYGHCDVWKRPINGFDTACPDFKEEQQ